MWPASPIQAHKKNPSSYSPHGTGERPKPQDGKPPHPQNQGFKVLVCKNGGGASSTRACHAFLVGIVYARLDVSALCIGGTLLATSLKPCGTHLTHMARKNRIVTYLTEREVPFVRKVREQV